MSFYDDASLVFLPSGGAGKDGKAYSIKPVPEYGTNLVTNGGFDTDTWWEKGTGWSISNGYASVSNGAFARLATPPSPSQILVVGKQYKCTFEVVESEGGELYVESNINVAVLTGVTALGIHSVTFTAQDDQIRFQARNNSLISIDNVSVREVIEGDGDFTFSRGSNLTATRIDSNGLIAKGRENLLLQSNQFDTTWLQTSCSVTSGQSGYGGSSDAWLLSKSGANGRVRQYMTSTGVRTASIYAKEGTKSWLRITYGGKTTYFDLGNGVLGNVNAIDSTITSVGNGFYRCTLTANAASADYVNIYPADSDGVTSGTSGSIYIQNAQLEIGLTSTEYIESGATTGLAGILEDSPRFDYSGGASCASLLLEGSRSNLIGYSEYLEGTGWNAQSGITLTANTTETLSPEGLNNAYKVVSTDAAKGFFFGGLNVTNAAIRTIYLKGSVGGETIRFKDPSGYGTPSTKTLTTDWQRFEMATTNDGNTYEGLFIDDISVGTIYAFGAQMEEGSYSSSYIPNHSGGSVTRDADDIDRLNNASINGILNNYNTTFLFEGSNFKQTTSSTNTRFVTLYNAAINNNPRVLLFTSNSSSNYSILIQYRVSGQSDVLITTGSSFNYGDNFKAVVKLNNTSISLFIDGVKIGEQTIVQGDDIETIDLAGLAQDISHTAKQFLIFPTALSTADCEILTGATSYDTFSAMATALNYTTYE